MNNEEIALELHLFRNKMINNIHQILHQYDVPCISMKAYKENGNIPYAKPILGHDDNAVAIDEIEDAESGIILTTENGLRVSIYYLNTDELINLALNLNSVWGVEL